MRLAGATGNQRIAVVVENQACWLIGWLWGGLEIVVAGRMACYCCSRPQAQLPLRGSISEKARGESGLGSARSHRLVPVNGETNQTSTVPDHCSVGQGRSLAAWFVTLAYARSLSRRDRSW
ncbi:hypothetical protein OOU_Y34scaffold00162g49 [Pyricularia oryzae Y34]|uniref:Uncharacterized protein n=2 Tax=Pyricularia oryzae TaxID=318829 RepID=A0AA97P743_PYRO3|nr:hypothetical protein OOU_Y34scaffold00162g49 [Pyricularia oryzae Y34]